MDIFTSYSKNVFSVEPYTKIVIFWLSSSSLFPRYQCYDQRAVFQSGQAPVLQAIDRPRCYLVFLFTFSIFHSLHQGSLGPQKLPKSHQITAVQEFTALPTTAEICMYVPAPQRTRKFRKVLAKKLVKSNKSNLFL